MEYVVERIVDCRRRSRLIEYLVKWKDLDESGNTWETRRSLLCKDLIKKFEEDKKAAKTSQDAASNSSVKDKNRTSSAGPAGGKAKRVKVVKPKKVKGEKDAEMVPPKVAKTPKKKMKV